MTEDDKALVERLRGKPVRITEDRKGRLLETIWELTDRFNDEDDEALGQMFMAITQFAEEAALDERGKVVAWLRRHGLSVHHEIAADEIEEGEHLK